MDLKSWASAKLPNVTCYRYIASRAGDGCDRACDHLSHV